MDRLVLKAGFPDEPDGEMQADAMEAVARLPGPVDFFRKLFTSYGLPRLELNDKFVILKSRPGPVSWVSTELLQSKSPCGDRGVALVRSVMMNRGQSSSAGERHCWEPVGLPDLWMRWLFNFAKCGQYGEQLFRHKCLIVVYIEPSGEQRFRDAWSGTFDRSPVLVPARKEDLDRTGAFRL